MSCEELKTDVLQKALHEGRLGDDPLLLAHVNRAIEEQKEKDDAKNAITIVEDNEHVRAGPSTIPGFGRGLFAVHDLAQYEEVSRTRPLVSVVYEGMEGDVCDWCFANAKAQETNRVELAEIEMPSIKRCSACRECGYCSHDCQQKAWNAYHKLECKAYRSPGYKNVTPDFINGNTRTVVRLLCMLKMGTMGEAKLEEIMELPHNSKETIKKTEIRPGFIMDPTALLRKRAQHSIAATGTGMEAEKVYDLLTIVSCCLDLVNCKYANLTGYDAHGGTKRRVSEAHRASSCHPRDQIHSLMRAQHHCLR